MAVLKVGSTWRRVGQATRVDGPADLLLLNRAQGEADLRRRAAKSVHRLIGAALEPQKTLSDPLDDDMPDRGFVVTDGQDTYTATEVPTGPGRQPLLMFVNELPPLGRDLWVVRTLSDDITPQPRRRDAPDGVICFAAGTLIDTPTGQRPVEDLAPGDHVLTKDNGAQEVLWTGSRVMTGARLYAMPHLRPIRVRAGALDEYRPDHDLIVSPRHRLLIRGRAAEMLFQASEVLVAAEDLINDRTILVDYKLRSVTYVHVMLDRHQVVWANGVETESFHPANTSLASIHPDQREGLLAHCPGMDRDPFVYGDFARRNLSTSEAAILQHEVGLRH
ncbi:Hint domain-containing protein [Actibacterium sp. XHP0104]|uniref:Hint domain-containing protein n=1 Tax=Actibacterium sp. XHP0104 TaxID=2984335 RepID=UPI002980B70B|nr:Hint domain-containing protein [Actibacterium sp. XHP0104]